jgi:molybdopterin-guanine dinucleotide biosynthesis protein A
VLGEPVPRAPSPRRAFLLLGRATRLPGKFDLPVEGTPILERELRVLESAGLHPELISTDPRPRSRVPVHVDPEPRGPLGGLSVALSLSPEPFFLFGADMPFLDRRSIAQEAAMFDGRSVVPRSADGTPQVLHAIYARVDRIEVERLLARGRGLRDLVDRLETRGQVRWAPAEAFAPRSFDSVNTPAEYASIFRSGLPSSSTPDK